MAQNTATKATTVAPYAERLRLTSDVAAAVTSSYSPDSLRTGVAILRGNFDALKKNVGGEGGALERAFLEYYLHHGHPAMSRHLEATKTNAFAPDFRVDQLVSSFKRSRPPEHSAPPLDVLVNCSSDSRKSSPCPHGCAEAGKCSDKAKNALGQQRHRGFEPDKQGSCLFCLRGHPTSSCRALKRMTQVFDQFPQSALLALPEGCALTLENGKQYSK